MESRQLSQLAGHVKGVHMSKTGERLIEAAAQAASMTDQACDLRRALEGADRILVENRNALGEMDVQVFPGNLGKLALALSKP